MTALGVGSTFYFRSRFSVLFSFSGGKGSIQVRLGASMYARDNNFQIKCRVVCNEMDKDLV